MKFFKKQKKIQQEFLFYFLFFLLGGFEAIFSMRLRAFKLQIRSKTHSGTSRAQGAGRNDQENI